MTASSRATSGSRARSMLPGRRPSINCGTVARTGRRPTAVRRGRARRSRPRSPASSRSRWIRRRSRRSCRPSRARHGGPSKGTRRRRDPRGHGYLPHQFLSPLTNQRTDEYGGSFDNRLRFLRELLAARAAVSPRYPIGIRISDQYAPGVFRSRSAPTPSGVSKRMG